MVVVVLRARRRVECFIVGITVVIIVCALVLLPSIATLWEILSPSILASKDVLSRKLSAGALTTSTSSLRITGAPLVSWTGKDSNGDGIDCGDLSSCLSSTCSSTPDRIGGNRGSSVSNISAVTPISGDFEPESSLWKEDKDAEVDEDGTVVVVGNDDDAIIVIVVGIVVEEDAVTVVVVVAGEVVVVVVAGEAVVVVVVVEEAVVVVVVVIGRAVVVVVIAVEAVVTVIVVSVDEADDAMDVITNASTVAAVVVGVGVIVVVVDCPSFLLFPLVIWSDFFAFRF